MNNTAIHESHSDIEELFDDEEGERPCYLSDEVQSENANRSLAASNSDTEIANTTKLSNLGISSSSTQEDGKVHESGLAHEISKVTPGNHEVTEEGKSHSFYHLFRWMSAMNQGRRTLLRFMHFNIYRSVIFGRSL